MPKRPAPLRRNQLRRTRNDLLAAAARLLQEGRTPDMDQVAAEAMVSRATAYRYFPSIESLLIEAPLEGIMPDPARLFGPADADGRASIQDPAERVDRAEAALHDACYRNELQLRLMLAASLERALDVQRAGSRGGGERRADRLPVRQNRRTPLIEAALAPARRRMSRPVYERLCAALALVFGTESMIVFEDVLGLDEKTARRVKSWTVRALVAAALAESSPRRVRRSRGPE
ncbi:MAG TPA: helix-turn-helix domain-containing protein [Phycisphaerales bacterium]|nr:helix-turn-helix domain-containing protein [Phycisphaerales bacterium]